MPRTIDPTYGWPSQRHYLQEALKHLAAFTDNLQTFLELSDEHHAEAQVLTLDFGTSAATVEPEPTETVAPKRQASPRSEFPNRARPWTEKDHEILQAGVLLGLAHSEIAKRLGRTTHAIDSQLTFLRAGGSGRTIKPAPRPWTFDDERRLRELWDQGLTNEEMADAMNRSVESVKKKRMRLQAEGRF